MNEKPATPQAEPARGGLSSPQSNGWRSKSIRHAQAARTERNRLIARLKRDRVYDEFTAAQLLDLQRQLRADFYARQPKETTA